MASNPARFRRDGDRVLLEGTVNGGTDICVFVLPEGYRPAVESHFDVETESGPSVVTISPDGSVLAISDVGWVRFDGIEFDAAD